MRPCAVLVVGLWTLGALAQAQEPAPDRDGGIDDGIKVGALEAAAFDESNLIRVNTRLVEVDVVVRDGKGPVAGLTADDFSLYDNGKRVPIVAFASRTGRRSTRPRAIPKGATSNRLNDRGEEPAEATILLWDVLNTEMQDQAWVQAQVLKYLRTLGTGDRVALYRLVKTLHVIQDFTGDPERLRQAAEGMRPEQSVNLQAYSLTDQAGTITNLNPFEAGTEEADNYDQMIAEMNQSQISAALEMEWYTTRDRALITLNSLRSIAQHLHGIPGRKKVIWISGSFPAFQQTQNTRLGHTQIESLNIGLQIQKAIEELNESNVAIYPVDPRGLTTGFSSMAKNIDFTQESRGNSTKGGLNASGIDTMNLLAGATGGRAFYSTNDITAAVNQIFEDYDITYTLGFQPTESKLDRSYHNLNVKVNRKGAEVRYRRGYYDEKVRTADEIYRQANMSMTMRNELDATGVGLTALSEPVKETPGNYQVTLIIDANDLTFVNDQGGWISMINYGTYFSETPGLIGTTEVILIKLGEERYREVLRNGVIVSRRVDTGGETGRLRIAIQDRTTGTTGSVWVSLK